MKLTPDFAKLTDDQISKIKDLEQSLGLVLVAYEKMPEYADLTDEQLEKIKSLESEFGYKLVAMK